MPVINCVCGQRMEGADDEALFQAVRAHSDAAHGKMAITDAWIRDLLATRARLTPWEGERAPLPGSVEVRPLRPERLDDWLRFFDHDAFMDNPDWASCYCMFYHLDVPDADWEARTTAHNRADKSDLIRRGEAHGWLAYVDGKPAGWCHAAPRATLAGLAGLHAEGDTRQIGSIVCFVVAAPYRRQGVATRLLEAACQGFREQGLAMAEAYPPKQAASDARAYHGPLEMYLAAGFTVHRETEGFLVVRRELAPAG